MAEEHKNAECGTSGSKNRKNAQNRKVLSIARKLSGRSTGRRIRQYLGADILLFIICVGMFIMCSEASSNDGTFYPAAHRRIEVNRDAWAKVEESGGGFINWFRYSAQNRGTVERLLMYRVTQNVAEESNPEKIVGTELLYELPVSGVMIYMTYITVGLFILQLIKCLIARPAETRHVRKILKPIGDIAAKAEALTRMELDESKYRLDADQYRPGARAGEILSGIAAGIAGKTSDNSSTQDSRKYHDLEEKISGLNPEESLPLSQGDGDLIGIETAINNLLYRMRESNMQQARFVNDASHELRTPIAVIEGYSNMLARWGREDEKVLDESINAIRHESAHMKYLVEQLLFLARGDSGKTVLHYENTSLTDMMREIYEESLMIDEQHVYRFSAPKAAVVTGCDQALLKQAVRILVDNASKYTKENDEIMISVGTNEEGLPFVQVQDSGIGMEESDIVHMFERFYRADEARTYKGTGLGLSIAKWIVDKHKGHFEIVSRTELGTRIRIVLPQIAIKEEAPVEPAAEPAAESEILDGPALEPAAESEISDGPALEPAAESEISAESTLEPAAKSEISDESAAEPAAKNERTRCSSDQG